MPETGIAPPQGVAGFDPVAMGLRPIMTGGPGSGAEGADRAAPVQTGWYLNSDDPGFTGKEGDDIHQYGMNGEDLGSYAKRSFWDSGGKGYASILASAFMPGLANSALGAGGLGLSGTA